MSRGGIRRGGRSYPRCPLFVAVVVATLSACTSVVERSEEAARDVQNDGAARIGVPIEVPATSPTDGSIASGAALLLDGGLTEDEAVRVAFLNNREFRARLEGIGMSAADLVQAGLLSNPVLSGNAKFFEMGTEIEFGLAQPFLELLFLPRRSRMAEAEFTATKALVTREMVDLAFEVRRACVRLRAARQIAEVYESAAQAAKASFELMDRLHAAGNVTESQLAAEEAGFTRARISASAAQAAAIEAREPLNVALGLWGPAVDWTFDGRLPERVLSGLELSHLESRAIEASLDLQESRARAEALAQRAGLASWEVFFDDTAAGGAAKREAAGEWGVGPELSLPIPVFDRGEARAARTSAALRERLHQHTAMAVRVRSAARLLRERLIALDNRAAYFREVHLPARSRLVRGTMRQFNAMQIGVFDVLDARRQEIAAGRESLETLRDAWLARLDLEELLAGSLHDEGERARPPVSGIETDPEQRKDH